MISRENKLHVYAALIVVPILILLIIFLFRSDAIRLGLRWIEFLSIVPGLSGLLLLIGCPFLFLIGCSVIDWLSRRLNNR